jgi:NAD-dependent DNA ligase
MARLNETFIAVLGELNDIMMLQGEPFRARAYGKAQETIMMFPGDITQPEQLKGQTGIGPTILSKLKEVVDTGTLQMLEKERTNPMNILGKVYGIGPKKAKELIEKHGITSIEKLRKHQDDVLNDKQKIGLHYFEDIEKRIPRSEIDDYKAKLTTTFAQSTPPGSSFEIVGSYRRGALDSGDIDIIITHAQNDPRAFTHFVDALLKDQTIIEVLSRGTSKSMTITRLHQGLPARRVDFMYSPPEEYAFSILYFTGSKIFNTLQRQRAQDMGYTLNEHGIYHYADGKKGEKVVAPFPTEKSIFDFLKMVYKTPVERKDGRAVQLASASTLVTLPASTLVTLPPKKIKKTTLKKKLKIVDSDPTTILSLFKSQGPKIMSETELSALIRTANQEYYVNHNPIMTDNEYDVLIDYTKTHYPDNAAAKEGHRSNSACGRGQGGGAPCEIQSIMSPIPNNTIPGIRGSGGSAPIIRGLGGSALLIRGLGGSTPLIRGLGGSAPLIRGLGGSAPLPYQMWSMDKIKPDTDVLTKWTKKFKGPYVISCKVDGVSGLYTTEGPEPKLYTRGDGTTGQDVSHIIPYLKLPTQKNITIRGEFIITKALFQSKYAVTFANPRNFVAGVVNKKTIDADKYRDLSFVIYEVIEPRMKPSEQLKFLATLEKEKDIEIIKREILPLVKNELLSDLLIQWRANYAYEIDGLICMNDAVYPRPTGNPDYAFAFKMVLSDQVAESKVVDVIWTPSKDGYLKPRVQIEPVKLGGVDIEYATGFNASFIEENKIGVGALIRLIRSGDVIPHITDVIQPASAPLMPDPTTYEWNDTHVDIVLIDKTDNQVVKEKNITGFFTNIGVDGLASGNVKRIMAGGFDTIPKIIAMTKDELLAIEGFQEKMAQKIHFGIYTKLQETSLPELMHATNIFGRGFGTKKLASILNELPTILHTSADDKVKKISTISGMAKTTAVKFVDNIDEFLEFMKQAKLTDKLHYTPKQPPAASTAHPLYQKKYVMTGFRDKNLIAQLDAVGAEQVSSVSKNTFVVIVKELSESTGKVDEARKLNIPVMTPYNLLEKGWTKN